MLGCEVEEKSAEKRVSMENNWFWLLFSEDWSAEDFVNFHVVETANRFSMNLLSCRL